MTRKIIGALLIVSPIIVMGLTMWPFSLPVIIAAGAWVLATGVVLLGGYLMSD